MNIVRIIPGVRQDHNRQLYRIGYDENGIQHQVPAEAPELSDKLKASMEPIMVESRVHPGTFYESLACYQNRRV